MRTKARIGRVALLSLLALATSACSGARSYGFSDISGSPAIVRAFDGAIGAKSAHCPAGDGKRLTVKAGRRVTFDSNRDAYPQTEDRVERTAECVEPQ